MALAAVLALARTELRRSWRTLVLLGVLAGICAGVAAGGAGMARRTTSAHDRLVAATALDDVRVMIMGRPDAAPQIAALPGVRASWTATATVGQVRGGPALHYVAVTSGPPKPPGLFTPVVVRGRAPADAAADEVVVTEELAAALRLDPGSTLPLQLLEPEEVYQFDTGFGAPDGPPVDLHVTGVVRVASAGNEGTGPVYAGPAFADAYAPWVAGLTSLLRLEPGVDAQRRFEAALADLSASTTASEQAAEFGPLRPVYPDRRTDPQVALAERLLGTGLWSTAVLAALAGVLVVLSGFGRLAAAGASAQRTESALGLVTAERTAARVLPAVLPAMIAAVLAVAGGLLGGRPDPVGRLARYEPAPGWAPDAAVIALGAVLTVALVLACAALAAWSAGRTRPLAAVSAPLALPRAVTSPVLLVGAHFALSRGRGGSGLSAGVSARGALVAVALGITGVVAAGTTMLHLDELRASPAAYGWTADFSVVDAKEPAVAGLVADPAVADVDLVHETTVRLAGASTVAYAAEPRKGALPWTVVDGRMPRTDTELALGPRLAAQLDAVPGDVLPVGADGQPMTVVGLVQAPALSGELLGQSVVLAPGALARAAEAQPLRNAFVRAAGDPAPVHARYAAELEVTPATPPAEIANMADLGRLPELVAALLALITTVALGHALLSTTRRRAHDVGVLRAIGFTPRQAGGALVTMAGTLVGLGLLVGVPLGFSVSRLTWEESPDLGPILDISLPGAVVLAVVTAALLVAAAVAAVPARRAARLSAAEVLSAE